MKEGAGAWNTGGQSGPKGTGVHSALGCMRLQQNRPYARRGAGARRRRSAGSRARPGISPSCRASCGRWPRRRGAALHCKAVERGACEGALVRRARIQSRERRGGGGRARRSGAGRWVERRGGGGGGDCRAANCCSEQLFARHSTRSRPVDVSHQRDRSRRRGLQASTENGRCARRNILSARI